jgi:pimeloyl-ACP methyl ester carboxylesterase
MRVLVDGVLERSVVLVGATADPDPELTWARGVSLLVEDSGPDELAGGPVGVIGWSVPGLRALALAARYPQLVDRLVLIATPIPEDVAALGFDLSAVTAKTLLLYGAQDPRAGTRHGTWWQRRLPDARLEVYPRGDHDLLVPAWSRALSHLAPRCRR